MVLHAQAQEFHRSFCILRPTESLYGDRCGTSMNLEGNHKSPYSDDVMFILTSDFSIKFIA